MVERRPHASHWSMQNSLVTRQTLLGCTTPLEIVKQVLATERLQAPQEDIPYSYPETYMLLRTVSGVPPPPCSPLCTAIDFLVFGRVCQTSSLWLRPSWTTLHTTPSTSYAAACVTEHANQGCPCEPPFFLAKDSPQGPSTAINRQPPTANCQPPPTTANRQPPTANCHPPLTTANPPREPLANGQWGGGLVGVQIQRAAPPSPPTTHSPPHRTRDVSHRAQGLPVGGGVGDVWAIVQLVFRLGAPSQWGVRWR